MSIYKYIVGIMGNMLKTTIEPEDDFVEGVVCQSTDINENEMKTFELGEGKILLVKQNGKLSALGTKCTHYGAPLVNGALGDGRIRCQWHGACFNIKNGDIEDFPGLDSLPCYQVTEEGGEVKVRAKKSHLETNKITKQMSKRAPEVTEHIVAIGGGPASATFVETLRQQNFQGRISLICKEPHLPYDRVKVSKAMDFEIEKAQFRSPEFYKNIDIDVLLGVAATQLDTENHKITLSNGDTLDFDKCFLATGMHADKAPIPGADLENVVILRDYLHAKYVNSILAEDKEVVVLGSSFVALEAANYCLNKVKTVTLVARSNVPFKPLLGEKIGGVFLKMFQDKGVNCIMNSGLAKCLGNETGHVTHVELVDGTKIRADIVIMGVGSSCYTEFLDEKSCLEKHTDGSLVVDEFLQTNVPGVYAGGDIAHAPVWSWHNRKSTIGHYPLAHYHGRVAALNMLGKSTPLRAVPYFWTMLFGKGLRFAGHGKYTDIVYVGDVDGLKFAAFYLDNDEVTAASSVGMDPVLSQFAEMLSQGKKLSRADVEGDTEFKWTKKLHEN